MGCSACKKKKLQAKSGKVEPKVSVTKMNGKIYTVTIPKK